MTDVIQPGEFVIDNIATNFADRYHTGMAGTAATALNLDHDPDEIYMTAYHANDTALAVLAGSTRTSNHVDFTISFWINFTVADVSNQLFWEQTSVGVINIFHGGSGVLGIGISVNGGGGYAPTRLNTTANINKWHHVSCICYNDSGTQKVKVYVNGVVDSAYGEQIATSASTACGSCPGLLVGRQFNSSAAVLAVVAGSAQAKMSDLAVWDVALSDAELLALYNNGRNLVLTSIPVENALYSKRNNIINYWRMGKPSQNSGATVTDEKGSTNGTLVDAETDDWELQSDLWEDEATLLGDNRNHSPGTYTYKPKKLIVGLKGPATIRGRNSAYKVSLGSGGTGTRENLEN